MANDKLPVAVPYQTSVAPSYGPYGYLIAALPMNPLDPRRDQSGLGRLATAGTTIEAILTYWSVYAERVRFSTGVKVYRIPARMLARCEVDAEGYFIQWALVKYRITPSDPSPLATRLDDWTPVF